MVSKWKIQRDNTIQRVASVLWNNNITMNDVISIKEDELFIEALYRVNTKKEDMMIGDSLVEYEEVKTYCKFLDTPANERNIPLAKRIPLVYIEEHLKREGRSWRKLTVEERIDTLFNLGLAVKQSDENMDIATRYFVNMENYRGLDNKAYMGLVIVASERIDKAWLQSGYASDEAILYTRDGSLARELAMLSRR